MKSTVDRKLISATRFIIFLRKCDKQCDHILRHKKSLNLLKRLATVAKYGDAVSNSIFGQKWIISGSKNAQFDQKRKALATQNSPKLFPNHPILSHWVRLLLCRLLVAEGVHVEGGLRGLINKQNLSKWAQKCNRRGPIQQFYFWELKCFKVLAKRLQNSISKCKLLWAKA